MNFNPRRQIVCWLLAACAMIFVILIIGGITRLTQSGLSITEWEPIRGIIPPLTDQDWQRYFDAYRASPEYRQLNRGMSLDEFRGIFWWEYIHRMVARLFGLVLVIPMVYFTVRGWLRGTDLARALGLVALTAAQALLGWAMVQTGLGDDPYVSHFHLAGHLGLAWILFAAMWWWALELLDETSPVYRDHQPAPLLFWSSGLFASLVFLQSIWGAFVAGLDAGRIVTTFPKMGPYWIYPTIGDESSLWVDLTTNPFTVQFIHRTLGVLLLALALALWLFARSRSRHPDLTRAITWVAVITIAQVALGIATLVTGVHTVLGVVHQATGLLLFATALYTTYRSK